VNWHGYNIDPGNVPLKRAGVYLITNTVNGKVYVGISQDVSFRLRSHAKIGVKGRLPAALRKYGIEAFRAEPIYYTLDGRTAGLEEIEAQLIRTFDAIRHGYNTVEASGGVGPYGPLHGKMVQKGLLRAWKDPTIRAKFITSFNDPIIKERRDKATAEQRRRPEMRESYSKLMKQLKWITDGVSSRRIPMIDPVPEGWRTGRDSSPFLTETYRSKMKAHSVRVWSNEEFRKREHDRRVAGWTSAERRARHGTKISEARARPEIRAKHSAATSRLVWITDGKLNRRIDKELSVPDGWWRGRTNPKKG